MQLSLGPLSFVFVVFLILKLTHVIAWSWWLVFSPLLVGGFLFVIGSFMTVFLFKKIQNNFF